MAIEAKKKTNPNGACIEKGVWTALPNAVPATTNLVFTPSADGAMTFHMVGCSGDPDVTGPGLAEAEDRAKVEALRTAIREGFNSGIAKGDVIGRLRGVIRERANVKHK